MDNWSYEDGFTVINNVCISTVIDLSDLTTDELKKVYMYSIFLLSLLAGDDFPLDGCDFGVIDPDIPF